MNELDVRVREQRFENTLQKIVALAKRSRCDCGVPCDCSSSMIFVAGRMAKDALEGKE